MLNENRAVTALRLFLVMFFAILVVLETLSLPGQFAYMAKENPEDAHLRWPLTVMTVFWVVCVQVVIVATWKLLSLVRQDRIFSQSAFAWVDAIIWAITAAWLVLVGVFFWVGSQADDPGIMVVMTLFVIALSVLGLLMVVMRALLRQATALRTDLEAVI
jgi:hypothetical protein